jgi:uncharacterized protein
VIEIEWILAYIALGSVVGFLAGLFGIGGGGIMVPLLTTMFVMQGFPLEHTVHAALATSMAAIIFTSVSSLRAHHRHDGVVWPVVGGIAPGIIIGTFGVAFIASFIPPQPLAIFFVVFMFYVSVRMFLDIKPKPSRQLPGFLGLSAAGAGIGGISALAAIGGGSLTVPFLTWCNVSIQKAIGTSAAVGFPIAVAGTLGYFVGGLNVEGVPAYSLGYIYIPAVLAITFVSILTAPLGAKLAHRLPVGSLKKLFAGMLMLLCANMLYTVFSG